MSKPTIAVQQSRARKNELGAALINPDPALSREVLLNDAVGTKSFLPVYQSALQAVGESQAFTPSLEADGTLTFYLEAVAPPRIAGQVGDARPYISGTSFSLLLNASGASASIPLASATNGGSNNIWRLSAKLAGPTLKMASDALFDQSPNVAIEVVQSLRIAAPLTERFVTDNWSDPAIHKGLLATWSGIPMDTSSSFYQIALQADEDYASQYMLLGCTYIDRVAAPPLPGYIQWQVNWGNRAYNYYQDNQERSRVFFLPDKFELAKGPTNAATISLLQFTVAEGQTSVEKTRATFRIYGKPVVQFERVEDAKRALKAKIGSVPQMISLQDAHHLEKTFTQSLPNALGTGSTPSAQEKASIDLSVGIRNELNLNFQQFQALWAAIFSTSAENPLFRGWVDVQLLNGKYKDRIDFDGRLPKEQESTYFDDILDTSQEINYSTPLTVNTFSTIFQTQPTNRKIVELELCFSTQAVVTLTENKLKASVDLQRSIRDIVLGSQSVGTYSYRLRVVRADETITCCGCIANETNLWVTSQQVKGCNGRCSDAAGFDIVEHQETFEKM